MRAATSPESPSFAPPAWRLWLLFLAARGLVAVLLGHVHVVSDDQAEYLALRDAWLATGRFVNPATGLATAYRDPGYPLFLVLLARVAGVGHFAIWVAQSMIGALAGACLVATSTRAGGASAGRVTAVLFLLDLVFASYSFMVYPEVLAVGLICLALWAWPEASPHPARLRTTVTSVILSAAVLVRAAIAPLLLGIGIAGFRPGRRGSSLLVLGIVATTIALWSMRNLAAVGSFAPNTNAAINLYLGNGRSTPLAHPYLAMADSAAFAALPPVGEAERARAGADHALRFALDHPARCGVLAVAKVVDAIGPDPMLLGLARRGQFPGRSTGWWLAVGILFAGLSFPLRVLGLAVAMGSGGSVPERVGRYAFWASLATEALTFGHPRFTLVAWVLLLPGAALLAQRLAGGDPRGWWLARLAGLILACAWVWRLGAY